MRTRTFVFGGLLAVIFGLQHAAAGELPTPPTLWKDYDPNRGDFKEEIVFSETRDGIFNRESYISAYVLGEEVRVYCKYSVKAGAVKAPGILNVHGWMGAPNVTRTFVENGWAAMAHDYCGKTGDRKHTTKYPPRLQHGNMDREVGPPVWSETADHQPITDPKQASDYLWYAIQRRVLSYLEQQKEVDATRLAATGYSYGGTVMWALGTDPRVKAIVAYFGIGWTEYYRNKQVWMYSVPYVEPAKSPGEELYLSSLAPEAHVPYIAAATLWLNGSNDHHGGHERSLESFNRFQPGVPWAFAVQARGHHNTEKIDQACAMWLDKHVLGKDVFWTEQPQAEIRLDANGIPELVVRPTAAERVKKVEIYYALKEPCSFNRSWRDAACAKNGAVWIGKLPVMNVADYVFGYANVTYDTTLVLSTAFCAAIPAKLGAAKATDKRSSVIYTGDDGMGVWTDVAEVEGPQGIKGFRCTNHRAGTGTEQLSDPKWKAPAAARLGFKFYCTQPQTLILTANSYDSGELEITASDDWQEMAIPGHKLINRFSNKPMKDWTTVGKIHFASKEGSDITKVIFAEFKWVE
ncbi:MAG: prolyl oligopeptidase family serine peptidase [Planctomycetota bacterium]|nr:prolyl oligopeptidase family serine peptidase [Planctomycetota bacterium]